MIIFLLIFGLFLLFYIIISFMAVFAAVRHRMPDDFNIPMSFIFIFLSMAILWVTGIFVSRLDWSQGLDIFRSIL